MENTSKFSEFEKMGLTPQIKGFLREIGKWSYFLSILGFIGIGLMVLLGLFFGTIMSKMPGGNPYAALGVAQGLFGIIYILVALLYFMPIFYLYKFSVKIKKALIKNDNAELTDAFSNLKSHYKFIGIFMIIIFSIYFLIFLFGMLGAAFA